MIKKAHGIGLNSLTIKELSSIYPGEGVYIFKNCKKQLFHIGTATSSSFVERIPKHFDTRSIAWMNRLLKIICLKHLNKDINDQNLQEAAEFAFENLNLVLVTFSDRANINRIERMLRATGEPLNKFVKLRIKNQDQLVGDY